MIWIIIFLEILLISHAVDFKIAISLWRLNFGYRAADLQNLLSLFYLLTAKINSFNRSCSARKSATLGGSLGTMARV